LLAAASAAFLFFAPFASSAGLRAAMLIIAALALAFSRGRALLATAPSIPRGVAFTYGAWIALCAASLAWSENRAYSFSELRAESLYGTLALAIFFLGADGVSRWRLWWTALMAGTLAVLAAEIIQQLVPFTLSRHPLDGGGGAWSTHLVLIAPVLLVLVWPPPWGEERGAPIQAAALALLLIAAWDTENRIVWAALGVQLAIAFALGRALPSMDAAHRRNLARLTLVAGAAVTIAFGASIVERNEKLFSASSPVTTSLQRDVRPMIWAVAWEEYKRAPWIGHGFGREILAEKFIPHTPTTPNHPQLRHGHNMFVDVALQMGALGLAVFVALLAALAREYRSFLRDAAIAPLGVIGLAIVAGFVVKNLTDDFFHRHNALVFWALNGMLLGLARGARRPP
jgi:O-antigen ligase